VFGVCGVCVFLCGVCVCVGGVRGKQEPKHVVVIQYKFTTLICACVGI